MTTPHVRPKWRPPLALIVYAMILTVMAMPVLTVLWFRLLTAASGIMLPGELTALAAILALTLVVAYILTRTLSGPIDALIRQTNDIARGGRTAIKPLDSYGTREIAALSQSFLDLAGKLVDHSDYVRGFAAHVSHELKSPLTSIKGAAELMLDEDPHAPMTPEQRQRFLGNIIADTERLDVLLLRLRDLARAELPAVSGETALGDIVAQLAARFPALAVTLEGTGLIALPEDAAAIVFGNLAENALQHGASSLVITVMARERGLVIGIRDNGRGIPEGNRGRIFEPFFSTRRDAGGTGMGLSIVTAVVLAHGGSIRLAETGDNGTEFEVILPKVG